MASKRYRGKRCVYCGREGVSDTADHVIARGFFLPSERLDLPKVPACKTCNNMKSQLEHHVLTILPFGARHAAAARTLNELVPGRLARNAPLHRSLLDEWNRQWQGEYAQRWTPEMKLPLDSTKVTRLCEYMMTGLAWHHWGADLTEPTQVRASFFHPTAIRSLESLFLNERWGAKIDEDIGAGTMTYRAVQDSLAPSRTFWRFTLYGIVVGDAIGFPGVRADTIYGVSNPPQ
ncbi:hypothetical protein [Paraburkholderia sp. J8-2]|uniref:HNH endonuclease n=1 Tax=Paraburkholderia sp. J8-2 TaxID=2805440 RepID=UPI002AB71A6E|nr:hypothetical protein [Paraburkholderia sp. J8-2]